MAVLQVLLWVKLNCVTVCIGKAELISVSLRQRFAVGEQDVEDFHDSLERLATRNLKVEVFLVSDVLHPATSKQVWLSYMLIGGNTELLGSLKKLDKLLLVVTDVVRQRSLLLFQPLI